MAGGAAEGGGPGAPSVLRLPVRAAHQGPGRPTRVQGAPSGPPVSGLSSAAPAALSIISGVRGRCHGWSTRAWLRALPSRGTRASTAAAQVGASAVAASGGPQLPPVWLLSGNVDSGCYGLDMRILTPEPCRRAMV